MGSRLRTVISLRTRCSNETISWSSFAASGSFPTQLVLWLKIKIPLNNICLPRHWPAGRAGEPEVKTGCQAARLVRPLRHFNKGRPVPAFCLKVLLGASSFWHHGGQVRRSFVFFVAACIYACMHNNWKWIILPADFIHRYVCPNWILSWKETPYEELSTRPCINSWCTRT